MKGDIFQEDLNPDSHEWQQMKGDIFQEDLNPDSHEWQQMKGDIFQEDFLKNKIVVFDENMKPTRPGLRRAPK